LTRKIRERLKVDYRKMIKYACYTSTLEPRNVKDALIDEYWIVAMQKELQQFERNAV
jgi:hypothetical protein